MSDNRSAVLVPGARGGTRAPWHVYTGRAAERRGAEVHRVEWETPTFRLDEDLDVTSGWVRQRVLPVLDEAGPRPLVAGKSLGSFTAQLVAERALPAIWLTPLLTLEPVVDAMRAAKSPFLLVGGTADPWWDGDLARDLTPHVCELPGVDHGFFVPNRPLRESAAALGRLCDAVEDFLDTQW